jgi:hypothetical protein
MSEFQLVKVGDFLSPEEQIEALVKFLSAIGLFIAPVAEILLIYTFIKHPPATDEDSKAAAILLIFFFAASIGIFVYSRKKFGWFSKIK